MAAWTQELLAYASLIYFVAAAALYRLLLRLAFLASGADAYEREVHDSEGRIELRLTDRNRG